MQEGRGTRLARRAALAALTAVALGAITWWTWREAVTDYRWHAKAAERLASGELATPHFLFQLLLLGQQALAGRGWVASALDLSILCHVALALLLASLLERAIGTRLSAARAALAGALTLGLLVAGPVNLLSWPAHNLYLGYLTPTTHHNPTATLLRPLALTVWWRLTRRLGDPGPAAARSVAADAAWTVLSILAKPSQAIALAPAAVLVTGWRRLRREPLDPRALALGFGLPAAAALAAQYLFFSAGGAGVGWAPLAVMSAFPGWLPGRVMLSAAFPLSVVALRWEAVRDDMPLGLAWASFGCALVWVYGFTELGERQSNANLLWTGHVSLFVLFVASARLLLARPGPRSVDAACWAVLGLHVAGGLALALHPTWW